MRGWLWVAAEVRQSQSEGRYWPGRIGMRDNAKQADEGHAGVVRAASQAAAGVLSLPGGPDSPTTTDERKRRGARGSRRAKPHVLVMLPAVPDRSRVLRALGVKLRTTVLDPISATDRTVKHCGLLDLAILHANHLGPETSALFHDPALGYPEVVYVTEDGWSPQRFVLETRGVPYVICEADLWHWLATAAQPLCALALARRAALAAFARRPASTPPHWKAQSSGRSMRLHAAETLFRESFLRGVLAEHGSRRDAAEAAGVPYRSFCEMLRRLGV